MPFTNKPPSKQARSVQRHDAVCDSDSPLHCRPWCTRPYSSLSHRWQRCRVEKLYSENRCSESPAAAENTHVEFLQITKHHTLSVYTTINFFALLCCCCVTPKSKFLLCCCVRIQFSLLLPELVSKLTHASYRNHMLK